MSRQHSPYVLPRTVPLLSCPFSAQFTVEAQVEGGASSLAASRDGVARCAGSLRLSRRTAHAGTIVIVCGRHAAVFLRVADGG